MAIVSMPLLKHWAIITFEIFPLKLIIWMSVTVGNKQFTISINKQVLVSIKLKVSGINVTKLTWLNVCVCMPKLVIMKSHILDRSFGRLQWLSIFSECSDSIVANARCWWCKVLDRDAKSSECWWRQLFSVIPVICLANSPLLVVCYKYSCICSAQWMQSMLFNCKYLWPYVSMFHVYNTQISC